MPTKYVRINEIAKKEQPKNQGPPKKVKLQLVSGGPVIELPLDQGEFPRLLIQY